MSPNPFLGVVLHWLGGLASGSFYVPFKGVKKWSWETYWMVGGVFSWILCPWAFAYFLTNDLFGVLLQQSWSTLGWTFFLGLLWGFGGLTYGLTVRYLGLSLGTGLALGCCAALGTMTPPIFKAISPHFFVFQNCTSIVDIVKTTGGRVTLGGVAVCMAGIWVAALAGYLKESQMPEEQKTKAIKEFSFKKGVVVAFVCGVTSAFFAFALQAGKAINAATRAAGTHEIWTGLPTLPLLLLGGFTTNLVWCLCLHIKNRTAYQYLASHVRAEHAHHSGSDGGERGPAAASASSGGALDLKIPVPANFIFSAVAGTIWYFQFFFYTMGATRMGAKYDFASWTLHMASIIIFATMWGWIFHEWRGSSRKAHLLITCGIAALILSTVIIGTGVGWDKVMDFIHVRA
jgi:L-rhamnose-H+ transport protein